LAAEVVENAGVVLMDDPARERQPIEDGLEMELVRRALVDVGAAVGPPRPPFIPGGPERSREIPGEPRRARESRGEARFDCFAADP